MHQPPAWWCCCGDVRLRLRAPRLGGGGVSGSKQRLIGWKKRWKRTMMYWAEVFRRRRCWWCWIWECEKLWEEDWWRCKWRMNHVVHLTCDIHRIFWTTYATFVEPVLSANSNDKRIDLNEKKIYPSWHFQFVVIDCWFVKILLLDVAR